MRMSCCCYCWCCEPSLTILPPLEGPPAGVKRWKGLISTFWSPSGVEMCLAGECIFWKSGKGQSVGAWRDPGGVQWQAVRSKTWFEDVSTELKRKLRTRMAGIVEIDMSSIEMLCHGRGWLNSEIRHRWRCCRTEQGPSFLLKAWTSGRWSVWMTWRRRLRWWVVGHCITLTGMSECMAEELNRAKAQQMRWRAERDIDEAVAVTSRTRWGGRGGGGLEGAGVIIALEGQWRWRQSAGGIVRGEGENSGVTNCNRCYIREVFSKQRRFVNCFITWNGLI